VRNLDLGNNIEKPDYEIERLKKLKDAKA